MFAEFSPSSFQAFRRWLPAVWAIVALLAAGGTAGASCGDWLEGHPLAAANGADASSESTARPGEPRPAGPICDGPSCRGTPPLPVLPLPAEAVVVMTDAAVLPVFGASSADRCVTFPAPPADRRPPAVVASVPTPPPRLLSACV